MSPFPKSKKPCLSENCLELFGLILKLEEGLSGLLEKAVPECSAHLRRRQPIQIRQFRLQRTRRVASVPGLLE